MTQSYRGLRPGQGQPAAINYKGELLMSNYYWLTPEEKQRKKKRKKAIMYTTLMLLSVVLSAFVTVLANQI
jgi:hypothetical protein